MLSDRIAQIEGVCSLLSKDLEVVCRSCILYVLRLSPAAELRFRIEHLIGREPYRELKEWLDQCEYTLDRARRAIAYMVLRQNKYVWGSRKLIKKTVKKFKVASEDMELVSDLLAEEHKQQLRTNGLLVYKKNPLIEEVLSNKRVIGYCTMLAWRKLRFIAENDCGIGGTVGSKVDVSVWVQTLMQEARRIALHYAHFTDQVQLMNYVTRGVHNLAMRLIDYHTAGRRARIRRSDDPTREFDVPVSSLVGNEVSDAVIEENSDASILLRQLASDKTVGPLVLAVTGKDTRFNTHLTNKGVDASFLDDATLVKLAAKFLGVNLQSIRSKWSTQFTASMSLN
jgi:hypothetical protein